jgi:hypothetical protein
VELANDNNGEEPQRGWYQSNGSDVQFTKVEEICVPVSEAIALLVKSLSLFHAMLERSTVVGQDSRGSG